MIFQKKQKWLCLGLFLLTIGWSICPADASSPSISTSAITDRSVSIQSEAGILKIIETERWDTASKSWKALSGEQRWSNERGQIVLAPSEAQPPPNWEFDGDWKIVISGSDALGWEYTFHYLQAPTRRRVWLRTLKPKPSTIVTPAPRRRSGLISKALVEMRDGYNFKGFSLRFYKSLLSLQSFGLGISIPLTMNFDLWDRNPWLPSISSTIGFYFPLTFTAALSASIHVAWLKWFIKTIIFLVPRLLILFLYKFILPAIWVAAAATLLPLGVPISPLPTMPQLPISKPRYQSGISERVGCSLSYRWSKKRGIEWRFNYWHSYLPTFAVCRKFLGLDETSSWWDKHFGSLGLSTGYPLPLPPYYSCSLCLGLSGLYLKSANPRISRSSPKEEISRDSETNVSVSATLNEFPTNSTLTPDVLAETHLEQKIYHEAIKPKHAKLVVGTKAT